MTALSAGVVIDAIVPSGVSAWCQTLRIDARLPEGTIRRYFLKVQSGEAGRRMMEGTFYSESTYATFCPDHFYLCEYHDIVNELPDMKSFVAIVAKVHKASMGKSPTRKYGFSVPTHLANIPNDNQWQVSWATWYTQAMKAMFEFEKRTHDEDAEMETLFAALKEKVIPGLLRPLKTGGRAIEPCLIHSDLWPGNCEIDAESKKLMIFDSCAYWGHNEADLGSWQAPRYRLGRPYREQYKRDDRNALCCDLLVSGLYPKETKFREMAKKEMTSLIEKFPNGLNEDDPLYAPKIEET
ncbi:hypothetical protein BU23DRAFT_582832 [Bimuria novae-zelandiae CBS 107.79]|uniref:protein-ribulosamine 3-kinase n=1 Tax=Bimuria novae-zelandiae CBS 107.79 TaxID=1447943 RepID=A0A6A5UWM7_9PLEO|nr:hypothetical protein BU23DRAFT_582832 [Bimuria novae-zelandiae CBS 107.79]